MFDIGLPELLVILGVALIVLGPQRLPELARTLGKTLAELRRTSDELQREVFSGRAFQEPEPPPVKKPVPKRAGLEGLSAPTPSDTPGGADPPREGAEGTASNVEPSSRHRSEG